MRVILLYVILLVSTYSFSQSKLPVIHAGSKGVSIRDGGFLDKNGWSLSPGARPDIYVSDRTRKTKWVVFYTDIDSIKVKVKPGTIFNFIILLNGKDSCYTQVRSAIAVDHKISSTALTRDTIPFTLTPYNAIGIKSIVNDRDTLALHFDLGSFDFRLTKDAILKKTKLLSNQPEALAGKTKPDFNAMEKVNKIQLGNVVFMNPVVETTGFTARQMDGRFGWNIFEGKTVELDYDQSILVIHSKKPKIKRGFVKSKIEFLRSFVCIKGALIHKNKSHTGNFLLDSGSDQAMILDSSWLSRQNIMADLKSIKSSTFKDPRGQVYENKIVLSPLLRINGFDLTNIPTNLLGSINPVRFEVNYFGNDLLKRFNILLDFKKDDIYLKPNSLMPLTYLDSK